MSGEPPEGPPGGTFDASARGTFAARGPSQSSPGYEDEHAPTSARVPPPPSVPRPRSASQVPPVSSARKATLTGGTTPGAIPAPAPLPRIPDMDALIEASSRPSAPPMIDDPQGPPAIPRFLTPMPAAPVLPPSVSSPLESGGAPRRKSRRTVKIPDDAVPNKTPAPPPVAFAPAQAFTPEPFAVTPAPIVAPPAPLPPPRASVPFDDAPTPIPAAPLAAAMPAVAPIEPSPPDTNPFARAVASPIPPRFTAKAPLADEPTPEATTPSVPIAAEASPEPFFDAPIMPMRIISIGTDSPPPPLEAAPLVVPISTPPRRPPPVPVIETVEPEPVEPESVEPEPVEPESVEPESVESEPVESEPLAVSAPPRRPPPVRVVEAVEVDTVDEDDDEQQPTTQRAKEEPEHLARPEEIEEIELERLSDVTQEEARRVAAEAAAPAKKPPPPPPKRTSIEPPGTGPTSISPVPSGVRAAPPPSPPAAARAEAAPTGQGAPLLSPLPPAAPVISVVSAPPPPAPAAPPPAVVTAAPATPPPAAGPASVDPLRKRQKPWWEELFGDDYVRTMDKVEPKVVRKECDFIEDRLGLEKGAVILDLACGPGSHAIELSSRGYSVVGYDLSLSMLARAADEAQERGQRLNFLHGDMREMAFEETFDGVYCWSTSFGYFEDDKNLNVLQRIHRALRKGGLLLLDVVNRDYVAPRQPSLVWFEGDGCVCMDEMVVDFFSSRLRVKRTVMFEDGRARELDYAIRLYALHELGKMLHECGFKVIEVTGHPAHPGVFFGSESPRVIVLAERG